MATAWFKFIATTALAICAAGIVFLLFTGMSLKTVFPALDMSALYAGAALLGGIALLKLAPKNPRVVTAAIVIAGAAAGKLIFFP